MFIIKKINRKNKLILVSVALVLIVSTSLIAIKNNQESKATAIEKK